MAAEGRPECLDFLQFQFCCEQMQGFHFLKLNKLSASPKLKARIVEYKKVPPCFVHPNNYLKGILKKMRELDDKIIYALNVRLPTESFKDKKDSSAACKELFGELQQNSEKREQAIQHCIKFSKEKVRDLKKETELNKDNSNVLKELRKEQSKLRLLQAELGVEEVVKDKTSKVIYERCRMFYVPPNFSV